jgi:hypothetical protein
MKELCPRNKTEMRCEDGKVRTTRQSLTLTSTLTLNLTINPFLT